MYYIVIYTHQKQLLQEGFFRFTVSAGFRIPFDPEEVKFLHNKFGLTLVSWISPTPLKDETPY